MQIVEMMPPHSAIADFDGVRHEIDLSLIENPKIGDYVIIHAGVAIERLDVEEANERIKMFEEITRLGAEA
jgi:hydrogenase expression/formation protein HypC